MIYITKMLAKVGTALVALCGFTGQIAASDFSAPKIYSTGRGLER